jgi:hypothetical protein
MSAAGIEFHDVRRDAEVSGICGGKSCLRTADAVGIATTVKTTEGNDLRIPLCDGCASSVEEEVEA